MLTIRPLFPWLATAAIIGYTTLASAQAPSVQPGPPADLGAMPKFTPSNAVLQAALTDFSNCIDNTVAGVTASKSKSTTADTVVSQCAPQQAKLQQILPQDAFEKGMANTKQRVNSTLSSQPAAAASE